MSGARFIVAFVALEACLPGAISSGSLAEDRVTVQLRTASSPVTLLGQVLDYTGATLTIRLTNNSLQIVDAETVVSVETFYEAEHREALEAWRRDDRTRARVQFEAALQREHRPWVQREIHAGLMRLDAREGNLLGAAQRFVQIVQADPVSRHWSLAPLAWTPLQLTPRMSQQARVWLANDEVSARLIAASWLLFDPHLSETAREELLRLRRSPQDRLSSLARCQLWRLELTAGPISDLMLSSWKNDLERMPMAMRGGPQYLRATAIRQRGELSAAAAEFLWLPLVYQDYEPLVTRALLMAAECLEESGLTRESWTVYQELAGRYPWSSEAVQARRALPAELSQGQSDP